MEEEIAIGSRFLNLNWFGFRGQVSLAMNTNNESTSFVAMSCSQG